MTSSDERADFGLSPLHRVLDLIRGDRKERGDKKADKVLIYDPQTGMAKQVPEGTSIMPAPTGSDQPQPPWAKAEVVVDQDVYGRWMASVRERLPKNIRWGDDINAMVSMVGPKKVKVKWRAVTPEGIAYLNSLGNTLINPELPVPAPELSEPEMVPCKDFPSNCSQPFHPPKEIEPVFVDSEVVEEPMLFYVLNREKLLEYDEDRPHLVIAISDPTGKIHQLKDNPHCLGQLQLYFWDLDKKLPSIPEGYFTQDMAKQILNFVAAYKDSQCVYVACEAGISRSAGVAAALAKIYTGHDKYYFDRYIPNRRVYSMILAEYYNAKLD